ncbi:hypothetical protein [Acinetobacter tjernbergiae]|uniref:DUF4279 domain-containing protein n=1 Tax=Acinetobacter tjernbergiae DSM 14971 = CIP 107465 TaxID=1120928 RepID=V2W1F6_9GAMM|nr:hypothetical protein [Acinetobacter tjernbergiae]ESK53809.1 hypothetical protein F990_03168 [Acinetobacter tjernbergiae DSM 14971 = CIP 107465]
MEHTDLDHYNFILHFYIKHTYKPLALIQKKIPLPMSNGWDIGTERRAPNGEKLGGIRKETYWNYQIQIQGRRDFFNYSVTFLIDLIQKHQLEEFFQEITSDGGEVNLIINLMSNRNIGDTLTIKQLQLLAKYNINLGVEYFS